MKQRGFSLVEMMATIAIIVILTAVAIPAIAGIDNRASEVSAKRNAQQAAALSASANVVGIDHVFEEANGGIIATLEFLSQGIDQVDNSGLLVKLGLNSNQMSEAAKYLEIKDQNSTLHLIYNNVSL